MIGRRIAAIGLMAALAAGLAACGGDDEDDGGTTSAAAPAASSTASAAPAESSGGGEAESAAEDVEITFWTHTHPPMNDLLETLIQEYEDQHPNVTIKYEKIPNNDFGTKMLTSLSSGSGPDVINMDDNALRGEYIPKDLLAPLDPAGFGKTAVDEVKAAYLPNVLDGASGPDGTLYGVPSEFNATAFAINTAHFADAGLDPETPPATWDDVSTMGKQLVAKGHEGFNFLYLHSGWYSQQLQTLLNQTGGSILAADGKTSALTEPQSVAALEIWNKLIREDEVGNADTASREATSPFDDFTAGRRSMTMIYPWAVEQIRQDNPEIFENVKVVPLPQVDPANPSGRWYGYYFAVNKASKQQLESWKFIQYLASQPDRWLTDVNFVQPLTGWETSEAAQKIPFLDVWAQAYQQGRFDEVGPHWSEVQDALKKAVESTIFDGVAPADSLAEAAKTVEQSVSG